MKTHRRQRGAVLIVFIFIITLALTAYLLKMYNSASIAVEQNKKTMQTLQQAKEALIAWAVSNSDHLGQLPYPDRLEIVNPNYDGFSDCGGNPTTNFSLLIGQLPIYGQTAPCVSPQKGLGVNVQDAQGNNLWYAVSPNLVHNYALSTDPVINPSIIDSPAVPWLRVLDNSGNLISDRVAVVIIAPGEAIGGQNRANNAATVNNYLDSFQKNGNPYSNSNYDSADEDFVIGDDLKRVDDDDTSITQQPYLFNDKLVYITIDELMEALEKRVAREVVFSLNSYYQASDVVNPSNRYYPYASALGDPTHTCVNLQLAGSLPLAPCDTLDLSSYLPAWFTQNNWEEFIFFAISSDCSYSIKGCAVGGLTVGVKTNIKAIVISTGSAINTVIKNQTGWPSTSINDYLDSIENADGDTEYDAVGKALTNSYNDQMFIVAP